MNEAPSFYGVTLVVKTRGTLHDTYLVSSLQFQLLALLVNDYGKSLQHEFTVYVVCSGFSSSLAEKGSNKIKK